MDITPPRHVPYLGFPYQSHPFFEGVHNPLYARATVVSEGAKRVGLHLADAIGLCRRIMGRGVIPLKLAPQ